jgi:methyl-accepting chemotaxis protein
MAINLPVELQKLSGMQKLVYGAGALFGLAIAAPVAAVALSTVTSVAMAGVVGLGLFMGFEALPLILRWWRIRVFKLLKATARRNPVETLQLELINRRDAFEAAGAKVVAVSAMRDSLREKLDEYMQKHDTKDAGLERSIKQLSELVDRLRVSLRQAGIKLDEFEQFVARQADRWKLAKATGELAALLKETGGGDVTERFLHDEAIDSIRDGLNLSLAEIDQILQKEEIRQIVERRPETARGLAELDMNP